MEINWEIKSLTQIKAENIVILKMAEYYDALADLYRRTKK